MTKTLFEQVVDYKNLQRSYKQTQKGIRKFRKDAILYDMCRERNLVQLGTR